MNIFNVAYLILCIHMFSETGMVVHKACIEKAKDMQGK